MKSSILLGTQNSVLRGSESYKYRADMQCRILIDTGTAVAWTCTLTCGRNKRTSEILEEFDLRQCRTYIWVYGAVHDTVLGGLYPQ
jgi:hypothetical protein